MQIYRITQAEVDTWDYRRCAVNAHHYTAVLAMHEVEPAVLRPLYREEDEEYRARLKMIANRLAALANENN